MIESGALPESHFFSQEAMHTTFALRLVGMEAEQLRGMAREAIELLENLENKLSRFVEGSDVNRINHMEAGETLYLSDECYQCLLAAMEVQVGSGGLFDVTQGTRIEHRKEGGEGSAPKPEGSLIIHPDVAAVTCESPGRQIDLGGIGKGFALDRMMELLVDWGAPGGLLTSGASTLLAFGPEPWPIDLTSDHDLWRIMLKNGALSASGTGIQGSHIVHPHQEGEPSYSCTRLWVLSPTATQADAWSTALMLMEPDEAAAVVGPEGPVTAAYVDRGAMIEGGGIGGSG